MVNAPQNEKHRVFLKTVYSAGLRLREATHLQSLARSSSRQLRSGNVGLFVRETSFFLTACHLEAHILFAIMIDILW